MINQQMLPDFQHRSTQTEIMDDFSMEGSLLQRTLDQIAGINKWLGGNQITINGLNKLIKNIPLEQEVSIVDLGCGNGDILRRIADLARNNGRKVRLIGIDANLFTIQYAQKKSTNYTEISYLQEMIPSVAFSQLNYDVVLSTLFLHHFTDEEIITCLTEVADRAKIGVVINDLHRNRWAYVLFKILCLFIPNPMVREDGITSILRGFKKTELQAFVQQLRLSDSSIRWKWAFRYQWIINNQNNRS